MNLLSKYNLDAALNSLIIASSEAAHHNFSAESLTAALQCASYRRKAAREERSTEKGVAEKSADKQRSTTNTLELSEPSRSSSQQSLGTSTTTGPMGVGENQLAAPSKPLPRTH